MADVFNMDPVRSAIREELRRVFKHPETRFKVDGFITTATLFSSERMRTDVDKANMNGEVTVRASGIPYISMELYCITAKNQHWTASSSFYSFIFSDETDGQVEHLLNRAKSESHYPTGQQ